MLVEFSSQICFVLEGAQFFASAINFVEEEFLLIGYVEVHLRKVCKAGVDDTLQGMPSLLLVLLLICVLSKRYITGFLAFRCEVNSCLFKLTKKTFLSSQRSLRVDA